MHGFLRVPRLGDRARRAARAGVGTIVLTALIACGGGLGSDGGGGDGGGGGGGPCPGAVGLGGATNEEHNLLVLNAYRACAGVAPLTMDAVLSAYALIGAQEYAAGGPAHGHFLSTPCPYPTACAENQGWSYGQPTDFAEIDVILAGMWAEGPGGGHYDNMVNPAWTIVGVGIVARSDGTLFLTNDFQ